MGISITPNRPPVLFSSYGFKCSKIFKVMMSTGQWILRCCGMWWCIVHVSIFTTSNEVPCTHLQCSSGSSGLFLPICWPCLRDNVSCLPRIINRSTFSIVRTRFCPSGSFPPTDPASQAIHPNFNPNKCLDVRGAVFANGTPVQMLVLMDLALSLQSWLIEGTVYP